MLLKKLLPFAQAVKSVLCNIFIMEDKAPLHAFKHQSIYFSVADMEQLVWLGNSPDLNMKRETTTDGAPTCATAERAWLKVCFF